MTQIARRSRACCTTVIRARRILPGPTDGDRHRFDRSVLRGLIMEPMEALSVAEIPSGEEWQYEPKWDGFRCLLIRDGGRIRMQSKGGRDLVRYFPEVAAAALAISAESFI